MRWFHSCYTFFRTHDRHEVCLIWEDEEPTAYFTISSSDFEDELGGNDDRELPPKERRVHFAIGHVEALLLDYQDTFGRNRP